MANASIHLTDCAAARVQQLIVEKGNAALRLRAHVDGCGCAGFQYRFTLDDALREGDTTFTSGGVALVVDLFSYPHLAGAKIDCAEGGQGLQFVVHDHNEEVGCDC